MGPSTLDTTRGPNFALSTFASITRKCDRIAQIHVYIYKKKKFKIFDRSKKGKSTRSVYIFIQRNTFNNFTVASKQINPIWETRFFVFDINLSYSRKTFKKCGGVVARCDVYSTGNFSKLGSFRPAISTSYIACLCPTTRPIFFPAELPEIRFDTLANPLPIYHYFF